MKMDLLYHPWKLNRSAAAPEGAGLSEGFYYQMSGVSVDAVQVETK